MDAAAMAWTAEVLAGPGRGVLAADESTPTMGRRLAAVGVENTEERRRGYRQLLFTTEGLAATISGVILADETIRQRTDDGTPFPEVLHAAGIVPGIKVDRGTTPLAGFADEVVTEGLDGLRVRLEEYAFLGARFAKWRAVVRIGAERPTTTCLETNAHALARYAALAQEAGLVPVVEPEVLMDGPHDIRRCAEVSLATLRAVYDQLARHRVVPEATLLKTNMVLPGSESGAPEDPEEVADATIDVLREAVPAAVPGVLFLSGGQSDLRATRNLDAVNRRGPQPWELSFSFGRALQAPVLRRWAAGDEAGARAALLHRAAMNGAARRGVHRPEDELLREPTA
ncbi:class I fructose-bisphosphate aldolase [Trujillonella endophytica]|uniref:Probable fructose-bisphosphate aldolase class 1 n=1 Tax=Trujillonella endophytica TaxID=673521 RepID=A0A1H8T0V5_9ACTN|nr:class I fructose-bisphosphate aldolase [Trujillella endophytica]SEO84224.1 fructose-bisphosphate aldolase [Trujillella endophytica]